MIIGHKKQWDFLKKAAVTENFSHAYLFSGQEKLGKKKIVLEWASLLFGGINSGSHPDLILIEPENKEIQIKQIRDLIWKLSLKPYSAPFKVAVIDKAHSMNQEAQTCLLKTLEEPRGKTLLILISEMPEYLFPTILSRVQTLKFYPVNKEEIEGYLKSQNISEKEIGEISKASLGKPGAVIEYMSDSNKLKERNQKIKELENLSNSDLATRFQYAKTLSEDPQELKETLDVWLGYYREILISKVNGSKEFNKYSLGRIRNILKLIQKTSFLTSTTNVNPKLILEVLMIEL